MKKLLTDDQWKEIELEAKYKTLSFDSENNKVVCINETDSKLKPDITTLKDN